MKVDFSDFFQSNRGILVGLCGLLVSVMWMPVPGVSAQVTGNSRQTGDATLADSVRSEQARREQAIVVAARVDSARTDSVGFFRDVDGRVLSFGSPTERAELDIPALMSSEQAVFTYAFGTPGWPGGVSPFGLDPNRTYLTLDGLPFEDLLTGRARYDLLPVSLMDEGRLDSQEPGTTSGFHGNSGQFGGRVPLTRLRYRSSNNGFQAVSVVHSQSRPLRIIGPDDRIQIVFGYAGAGAKGEYPGSRLRRARRLFSRLRFQRANWSLELLELYNKRRIGANRGVLPISGQGYSSIYQRLGATVQDDGAERQTIRNDLSLRFRIRTDEEPLTVSTFWTTQSFLYRIGTDSTTARIQRLGIIVDRSFKFSEHTILVSGKAWTDRFRSGNARVLDSSKRRNYAQLGIQDRFVLGRIGIEGRFAVHDDDGRSFTSASLTASRPLGREDGKERTHLLFQTGFTGIRSNWYDRNGFRADSAPPLTDSKAPRLARVQVELQHEMGLFGANLVLFANRVDSPLVWSLERVTNASTASVLDGSIRREGVSLELSFRKDAGFGLYGIVRPSLIRVRTDDGSATGRSVVEALPSSWIYARIGVRKLLFKEDMNLDLSVRVNYWDAMGGRRLDPTTGLLMLPANDERIVSSSASVDIVAEAGIRTATVFLSYENLFSGTSLLTGNMVVPDYPLPAQRFRFGVFWPILN